MVGFIPIVVGSTVGLAVATVAIPAAVGAAGFTGAGIAAGSLASQMMSAAAIANGGGVAAGSTVAVLQSIGAAGLSIATKGAITAVGAALAFFRSK
ncbi:interferon alpha-inducible protein 27-like protein 2A isoform X1 [Emydura macquarii macquarii]|uniref:interferon alpha-inducible protein 27-like protein 2A isoform X1 n=1 Tax=Emydura macquarii macquarii TaxID=1129001 RepID=UPI00352BB337